MPEAATAVRFSAELPCVGQRFEQIDLLALVVLDLSIGCAQRPVYPPDFLFQAGLREDVQRPTVTGYRFGVIAERGVDGSELDTGAADPLVILQAPECVQGIGQQGNGFLHFLHPDVRPGGPEIGLGFHQRVVQLFEHLRRLPHVVENVGVAGSSHQADADRKRTVGRPERVVEPFGQIESLDCALAREVRLFKVRGRCQLDKKRQPIPRAGGCVQAPFQRFERFCG